MRQDLDPLSTVIGLIGGAIRLLESDVLTRSGMRLACRQGAASVAARGGQADWEALLADLLARSAERGLLRSGVDPVAVARVDPACRRESRKSGGWCSKGSPAPTGYGAAACSR
jgi:hypothetical protein